MTNTAYITTKWIDGRTETHDTYEDATDAILAAYPDAKIGHDGDLTEGGDRTLCWACEEDSIDDGGAKAVAVIRDRRAAAAAAARKKTLRECADIVRRHYPEAPR